MIPDYRLHIETHLDELLLSMQKARVDLEDLIFNTYEESYIQFMTNNKISLEKKGADNQSKIFMLNQMENFREVKF